MTRNVTISLTALVLATAGLASRQQLLLAQQGGPPNLQVQPAPRPTQTGPAPIQFTPAQGSPSAVSTILPPAPGTSGAGTVPEGSAGVIQPAQVSLSSEYIRQVYEYPTGERGDPTTPPSSLGATNGEENLVVAGIVMNASTPSLSRAMIRATGFEKTRYAVRAGDKIEQYRVVEIKATSVVLAVPVLGGVRTVVLERARDRAIGSGTELNSRSQRRQTVVTEADNQPRTGQITPPAARTGRDSVAITGPVPIRR